MSDGRIRCSGAEYRKRARDKQEEIDQILKKTPKLDSFFKKSSASDLVRADSSTVEHKVLDPDPQHLTSTENSTDNFNDDSVDNDDHLKEPENKTTQSLSKDPALWIIDELTCDYVALNGYDQNRNCNFSESKRQYKDTARYCQGSFFERKLINGETRSRSWLIYSQSTGAVYCGPCLIFKSDASQFSAKDGFSDWKNATARIDSHENSDSHKECMLKLKDRGNKLNCIDNHLITDLDEEIGYWKNILKRVVAVIKALAVRGLPFRGHDEKFGSCHNGNYLMTLELIAEFDDLLADHIRRYANKGKGTVSYLSKTICEEFIQIMATNVRKTITEEIRSTKYFSIIVDSTPDISHVDQLSVIIRYIQADGTPVERFIEFVDNPGHKAQNVAEAVLNTLASQSLDIADCRGQSYDNAANMSGHYTGLQARIKEINELAEYVPCSAHSLNLIGTCAAESCIEAISFFDTVQHLYTFFTASNHRWEILSSCTEPNSHTLKALSATRWSARENAVFSLTKSWSGILDALDKIEKDNSEKPNTRSEARGLIRKLETLETAFMVCLWSFLLERLNAVNKHLQKVCINIGKVTELYESLISIVEQTRNEFDFYENQALRLSEVEEYKTSLTKRKKKKIPFDETGNKEADLTSREQFRIKTFDVILDNLSCELRRRCLSYQKIGDKFSVFTEMENLTATEIRQHAKKLCDLYPNDLEANFENECIHFQAHSKIYLAKEEKNTQLLDLLLSLRKYDLHSIYPNIDIAWRIFMCTPVTNCSAERSFSCLKRIKNYLRSVMSKDRLNSLAILCIESDVTMSLNYDSLIHEFASQKSRRKLL